MKGRSRACFNRITAASTSSWALASSGRCRRPRMIRSSSGMSSGIRRMTASAGSTGATTVLGSSTSSRIRLAESTSNWPLRSWTSFCRRFSSVKARRWSASRPCPSRAKEPVIRESSSALAAASRAIASRPVAPLEVEIGLGDFQQRVVGRGLEPGPVRVEDPASGHGLEDRVGDPQRGAQAVQRGDAGPRRGPGTVFASAAVPPTNSPLRSIVWTWPLTVWIWPSDRYQVGP